MLPEDTAIRISQDAGGLTIEITNERPLELLDLTTCFLSIGDEYRRFVTSRGLTGADDARFYIQQIRTGSIIVDLERPGIDPHIGKPVVALNDCKFSSLRTPRSRQRRLSTRPS
jgi:hypothetical protein